MGYRSLNTDPEAADRADLSQEKYETKPKFWQSLRAQDWSPTKVILVAVVSLLAIWGAIDISSQALQWAQRQDIFGGGETRSPCWCGTSDEEAVAMGCTWDHIAVDWLPPQCVDRDLVAEFDVAGSGPGGNWPYYVSDTPHRKTSLLTETQRTPVNLSDIDQLAREGKDYWTTVEWHISHCLFTWRKQVRSAAGGVSVEPWNDKEAHASHCSMYIWNVLRTGRPLDEVSTVILGKDRHVGE
ncbi:hypothetical protein PG990_013997 [Apiospora arundinis]|uniref:Uncharacterized protein n=1 Tax=Apiospora arundinis TaxID=335852 RepID=A0ABR2I9E3_9PEZI